jgi:CAAX prenyl protease-like protein
MESSDAVVKPYVVPFFAYLVGASIVGSLPIEYYPVAYSIMVVAVSAVTWFLLRGQRMVIPHWRIVGAIVVGLVGIVLWILLSELQLETILTKHLPGWLRPGGRVSFNPFEELSSNWQAYTFIVFRLIGLSLLVPVAEEIFWRGFLARWLIADDWERVALGAFTWGSFWGVVGLFTLAHPEWFAAATYCALLNGLLYWKKDLWSCIVAHGVSNFTMGMYVLATGAWWLW